MRLNDESPSQLAGMKLYVLSDLHLEFSSWTRPAEAVADADLIVLAGDIAAGTDGVEWAARTFVGKPVIYVPGNHEFYGGHISRTALEIKAAARGTNVVVLDNDEWRSPVQIVGEPIRFLGCTLWTDFHLFGDDMATVGRALHVAKNCIADFSSITFGTTGWMLPAQSVTLHQASVEFLREKLGEPFDGKTIVVTHHVPTMKAIAPRYAHDIVSAAFASHLDDLVAQADLWVCGHTHVAADVQVGKCRVLVNPRGYVRDKTSGQSGEYTRWNSGLIVEV